MTVMMAMAIVIVIVMVKAACKAYSSLSHQVAVAGREAPLLLSLPFH